MGESLAIPKGGIRTSVTCPYSCPRLSVLLTVYLMLQIVEGQTAVRLCQEERGHTIRTSTNYVDIIFKTDDTVNMRGFEATWEAGKWLTDVAEKDNGLAKFPVGAWTTFHFRLRTI